MYDTKLCLSTLLHFMVLSFSRSLLLHWLRTRSLPPTPPEWIFFLILLMRDFVAVKARNKLSTDLSEGETLRWDMQVVEHQTVLQYTIWPKCEFWHFFRGMVLFWPHKNGIPKILDTQVPTFIDPDNDRCDTAYGAHLPSMARNNINAVPNAAPLHVTNKMSTHARQQLPFAFTAKLHIPSADYEYLRHVTESAIVDFNTNLNLL